MAFVGKASLDDRRKRRRAGALQKLQRRSGGASGLGQLGQVMLDRYFHRPT
jgi:hypothetical protein